MKTIVPSRHTALHIEEAYAAVQGTYQMCFCTQAGFTAVYLAYKGLTDTQIGLTSSLTSFLGVFLQLILANYSDNHANLPLKFISSAMYIVGIGLAAIVEWIPLPLAVMMITFSLLNACTNGLNTFLNAMMMQFVNIGIPVKYGWPRGVGSITYATVALVLGQIIEKHSASIIMPAYIVFALIAMAAVLLFPNPSRYRTTVTEKKAKEKRKKISYKEMISKNPTLVIFIAATCLSMCANSPVFTFFIRIVERLGGGSEELGIGLFLHAGMELPTLILSGALLKRFKLHNLLIFARSFNIIRLFLFMIAPNMGFFYFVMCLNCLTNGISLFASVQFANSLVSDGERVRAQSMIVLGETAGNIVGTAMAGLLIDSFGLNALIAVGMCIGVAASVMMFLCGRMYNKQFNK